MISKLEWNILNLNETQIADFYTDHAQFFTFIKSRIDQRSINHGSSISLSDNIMNSKITPYRDQVDYYATLLEELFKITGFKTKWYDKSKVSLWEAEIKQLILKILGKKERSYQSVVAKLMLKRVESANPKDIDK